MRNNNPIVRANGKPRKYGRDYRARLVLYQLPEKHKDLAGWLRKIADQLEFESHTLAKTYIARYMLSR